MPYLNLPIDLIAVVCIYKPLWKFRTDRWLIDASYKYSADSFIHIACKMFYTQPFACVQERRWISSANRGEISLCFCSRLLWSGCNHYGDDLFSSLRRIYNFRVYTLCLKKTVPLCDSPYLRQILTDFQIFFTGTFCGQVAVVLLLNIPPHLNCVSTLPCETLIVKNV